MEAREYYKNIKSTNQQNRYIAQKLAWDNIKFFLRIKKKSLDDNPINPQEEDSDYI